MKSFTSLKIYCAYSKGRRSDEDEIEQSIEELDESLRSTLVLLRENDWDPNSLYMMSLLSLLELRELIPN